ncbi:MAG: helix-turn-helix transcriptional regulator [Ilumatobacteraceae bacterium]
MSTVMPTATVLASPPVGAGSLLRSWRERRRVSQLELSTVAAVSTRHLSYVETGRSRPSRELLLHLAERLDVPLRERNQLLLAAGFAPVFTEFDLDDPEMRPIADALSVMLAGNEPNPTIVMDRHWNLLMANDSALLLTAGAAQHLFEPNINILRLSLHPDGLSSRIVNFAEVAHHLIDRLRRQIALTGDPVLGDLLEEALEWTADIEQADPDPTAAVVPMTMLIDGQERSFFSMVSTFGTAADVTAAELTIETFYPA